MHFTFTKNLDHHCTVSMPTVGMPTVSMLTVCTVSMYKLCSMNIRPSPKVVEEFYSTKFHIREDIEMSLGFDGEMIRLSTPRVV